MTGRSWWLGVTALVLASCGDEGVLPTSIDPGEHFNIAEVVYDEGYFYCRVEPMLFQQGCGAGDPNQGDPSNGCHFNVTTFRMTEYAPLVGDSCGNGVVPAAGSPAPAQGNYQSAQSKMNRDPSRAPLLTRPTGQTSHPRVLFSDTSAPANLIREWATRFSTQ